MVDLIKRIGLFALVRVEVDLTNLLGVPVELTIARALRERVLDGKWANAWAMRNRITHGYIGVDTSVVQDVIDDDLPGVERELKAIFASG